jgi:non-homologous end joining protein Ku
MKDEDFEKVRIESTHSIDITDFVDLEQVDPKFFYRPYFLEPQKAVKKPTQFCTRRSVVPARSHRQGCNQQS